MQLTSAQYDLLRSQPHRTNLWLSIYRPRTIMSASVTGTYSTGDRQISYYAVTTGSYPLLYPDMTVLVGTQQGSDDVGRIRLRSATGTYVNVAENALQWQTGYYLTFKDYIPVEAIYPRIIQDPSNPVNVIFYKDYDIPYSNQNTIYGTFVNAGSHRAAFLNSGTASLYWTATGTYNVAGSALTYSWHFEGGSPTGSTALSPGNITYPSPGHYKTRLRVTAANGAVDDTYRYVSIYNRPNQGTSVPTLRWELNEMSGSRDQGGYTASFKLYENIGEIEPNALIVIFADNWYGGTIGSLGGNASGNSSIVFVGYVLKDTIRFDYQKSYVEFDVGSVSEVMKEAEGFSVSCESKASPTTWFELAEMTVPKAMYHYMRWHSTVLKTTDFQYTGDDRLVQYFDADRGSLYDAIDSFMRDGMLGALVTDRQGKLWAEINSFGLQTPLTTIPRYMIVHKQDWIGTPSIQERRNSDLSFIELGGIAYYGVSTNAFSALLANAPSTVPLYHGKSERNDGLILTSQEHLNQISGNYLAHFNTKFPEISMELAGNYNNIDIAPLERYRFVIDQNDSVRGKSIADLSYIPANMEWNYDSNNEIFRPSVTFQQIATGTAGQTVLIPAVPPDGGYSYPKTSLPPLPGFGNSNPVGPTSATRVVIHDTTYGLLYSTNFDSGSPTWNTFNGGLSVGQYQAVNRFIMTPNGACYCGFIRSTSSAAVGSFLAYAPSLGSLWTIIYDDTILDTGSNQFGVSGLGYNPSVPETIGVVLTRGADGVPKFYVGSYAGGFSGGGVLGVANFGFWWTVSFGYNNQWMATRYDTVKLISLNGSSVTTPAGSATNIDIPHVRGYSTGRSVHMVASTNIYISEDNYASRTSVTLTSAMQWYDNFYGQTYTAIDGTGMYLMARWGGKGKSSDGGYSWLPMPTLPVGNYWFENAGDSNKWLAAGGSVIRSSNDFGNSWIGKEGNAVLLGLNDIDMIKYCGST